MKKHGFMFAKHFGEMFIIWSRKKKKFLVTRNFLTRIFDYIAKVEKDSQASIFMIVRVNFNRSWN